MKDFQVGIYPLKDKTFLTTFIHPLTKRKVREHFSSRDGARDYSESIERKFKNPKIENFQEMTLEELIVYFMNERPKNNFVHCKSHLIDFIATFGQYKFDDLTTDALKAWLCESAA